MFNNPFQYTINPGGKTKFPGIGDVPQQPLAIDDVRKPHIRVQLYITPNSENGFIDQIDQVTQLELESCVFSHSTPGVYFIKFKHATNNLSINIKHNNPQLSKDGFFVHTDTNVMNGICMLIQSYRIPTNFSKYDIEVYDMNGKVVKDYNYLYLNFKICTVKYQ